MEGVIDEAGGGPDAVMVAVEAIRAGGIETKIVVVAVVCFFPVVVNAVDGSIQK